MKNWEKCALIGGGMLLGLVVAELTCPCSRKKRRDPSNPKRPRSKDPCPPILRPVYRRADPLIYDQYYLMKQGVAVTWDNPDIRVEQGGIPVPQHQLKPDTAYDVVARIWNGSVDAPAVNMPVEFSYLSFGIGGKNNLIGTSHVDVSVKGGPECPAFTKLTWRTPSTPGHYCLQVRLIWTDDANPNNNLGQSNTDVKALNSPHARFTFPLRKCDKAAATVCTARRRLHSARTSAMRRSKPGSFTADLQGRGAQPDAADTRHAGV